MKKLLAIALAAIVAVAIAVPAQATPGVTVVIAGGEEADAISISVSLEGGQLRDRIGRAARSRRWRLRPRPEGMPNQFGLRSRKGQSPSKSTPAAVTTQRLPRAARSGCPATRAAVPAMNRLTENAAA